MSFGFDFNNVKTEENVSGTLPAGTYTAKIERVEKKIAKTSEANKYLSVMYKVCDMEKRNGAVFFDKVNIFNTNPDAETIGRSRLKAMFLACGAEESQLNDLTTDFLLNKKVDCVLGIEKNAEYGDRNKVYQVVKTNAKQSASNEDKQETTLPDWM